LKTKVSIQHFSNQGQQNATRCPHLESSPPLTSNTTTPASYRSKSFRKHWHSVTTGNTAELIAQRTSWAGSGHGMAEQDVHQETRLEWRTYDNVLPTSANSC